MSSVFPSLHESLRQVLAQRMDWTELREVQERTYRAVAAGNDVLVIAPTAGGKTEAALIPVLDDILKHGRPGIACLFLAPTKALINNQEERILRFCTPLSLKAGRWHGDVPESDRAWKDEPPHLLLITPESLEVLFQDPARSGDLARARFVIVDELHSFVGSDRGVRLRVLLGRLDRLAGRKIPRIGLSATAGNPEEILAWLSEGRHGADLVAVPPVPREKRFRFTVEPDAGRRIDALVRAAAGKKALVFVNSRGGAEELFAACKGRLPNLAIHHSSISPAARKAAEEAFASRDGACIICTSTLELGIDIGDLDTIIQVGVPDTVASFLQRMGRSGRRGGAASVAWILKSPREFLCSIAVLEAAMEQHVEDLCPVREPWNVLVQQLFLYLRSHPRTTGPELAAALLAPPVFAGMQQQDFDDLLGHLGETRYLVSDGGVIMAGPEAERSFQDRNAKDLFSVIAGGGEYRAVTPDGDFVGTLDARFVTAREPEGVLLGGTAWSVLARDTRHNLVVVAPGGEKGPSRTFWTGGEEEGLSPLVCRTIKRIVLRGSTRLPLREEEHAILEEALSGFPAGLSEDGLEVMGPPGGKQGPVTVCSFEGLSFNHVLALLLGHRLAGAEVRYNDLSVVIRRAGKEDPAGRVAGALRGIRAMDPRGIPACLPLPPRDAWKFADLLPEALFLRMAAADYYHGEDLLRSLARKEIVILPPPSSGSAP